jgi:hypothetical protein
MTPADRLIYYEVDDSYESLNCDLNSLHSYCKKFLYKNKI